MRKPDLKIQFPLAGFHSRRKGTILAVCFILGMILLVAGCAKYNTYYNAKRHFDDAEAVRDEALRNNDDAPQVSGGQRSNYEKAIKKSQKVLDEYAGHSLTDDVLFLQGKSYHRLESFRMSIRKLDLLFLNYPATEFLEEALYLQALNYLLLGSLDNSQEFLDRLAKNYPKSQYQAETRRVSGENAFTMREYEQAAVDFGSYLSDYPKADERDLIGLKLARCYWEMEEYPPALPVLQEVNQISTSPEVSFRSRLLLSRVHVKMGDFDLAEDLMVGMRGEAEIYASMGEVRLVEVESLVAQGKIDEATPLLEGFPPEWDNPQVIARKSDIRGYLFMVAGNWEEAKTEFQIAVRGNDILDDIDGTRSLLTTLGDYLGAEQGLVDASGPKVGRLKLLQANAMIFGFENPSEAARLYREAAADTASDSTVVVRALYGAHLAYAEYLDMPDSASFFADELLNGFPASSQAMFLSSSGDADILSQLLAEKEALQQVALANLTDEERAALIEVLDEVAVGKTVTRPIATAKIRRRQVYLKLRDNIVYAPSEEMIRKKLNEQNLAAVQAEEATVYQDTLGMTMPDSLITAAQDTSGLNGANLPAPVLLDALVPSGAEAEAKKTAEEDEEEEDEFDLR